MKFAIITHVNHIKNSQGRFAYAPYVREMNLWLNEVDEVIIVAPEEVGEPNAIHESYCKNVELVKVPTFSFTSIKALLKALILMPIIFFKIVSVMRKADHIHLRCPGNMGLLGCFAQIFFPSKPKTAKYAGNWDWNSKQPWSYRLQQHILRNTFLTRNMKVLVYGDFEPGNRNIKPFFTATYTESERISISPRDLKAPIRFVFAGTLSSGKQPDYAISLVIQLQKLGVNAELDVYGEGIEKQTLSKIIEENQAESFVRLNGNADRATLLQAYKNSHFLILASKSEGWPKVVAEAMFWACVPIATRVSCVPFMLDEGNRGVLLSLNLESDEKDLSQLINQEEKYKQMAIAARDWSQKFTLDLFAQEIKLLLGK